MDLLGFGASDLDSVAETFSDIAAVAVDDGIVFDPASVTVEKIRKEAGYGGVRVIITGELAKARCKTQIGVGYGDAVTPAPVESVYPVLRAAVALGDCRRYSNAHARKSLRTDPHTIVRCSVPAARSSDLARWLLSLMFRRRSLAESALRMVSS